MGTLDEHARAGIQAIEERRFDDAVREFQAACAIQGDRPDMNHALGMAYLHRGDAGNAIPCLQRAVDLAEPYDHPDNQGLKREFHLTLASAYQLMDQTADAQRVLEGMVARWPEEVHPKLRLAALLVSSCRLEEGLKVYESTYNQLGNEDKQAIEVLVGAVRAFLDSDHDGDVFLRGHCESYLEYFDEVAATDEARGWIAEAARMSRGADGELVPILAEGARPYAMSRVDLVNPASGEVSHVYTEAEPMIVALNGLEPLAQAPILMPWKGQGFDVWVCTQCPWHWLPITVQFKDSADPDTLIERLDETFGAWFLTGYNGEYGDRDKGRFHFVTDPEVVGDRAVGYVVDLGRSKFDAIPALLRRLTVLADKHPIQRVLFGTGRLP